MPNNTATMAARTTLAFALCLLLPALLARAEDGQTGDTASAAAPAGSAAEETIQQAANRDILLPGEEAASTLFSAQVGDADVDFLVDGSWRASTAGTLGWAFHPPLATDGSRVTFPYTFPGMETIPLLNSVDLTASLWLYKRYYFEATFADEFKFNSFLFGYQGQEGEFLQQAKVGNAPLSISPYPYIAFSEGTENKPGASALFQTEKSTHELLVRYEASAAATVEYYGLNRVNDTRINPASYAHGRFFVLPDTGVQNLEVYVESDDGDSVADSGARFRKLSLDAETEYSAADGYVFLNTPAKSRVAVYYTKGGLAVGTDDPSLGVGALVAYTGSGTASSPYELNPPGTSRFYFNAPDYMGINFNSDARVRIDGKDMLVLYQPGRFNPFEIQGKYDVSGLHFGEGGRADPSIVVKGGTRTADPAGIQRLSLNDSQTVLTVGDPDVPLLAAANRYPFARDTPLLYGPNRNTADANANFELLLRALVPASGLSVPADTIPGSVTVTRNGSVTNAYRINYSSGSVMMDREVLPGDVIKITYRTYGPEGSGGDLLFASGNTFALSDYLTLKAALGVKWNVLTNSYSTSPDDYPGSVTTSAKLSYQKDNFKGSIDGALQLSVPDTTGKLRLLGMEDKRTEFPASDSAMVPSAPPGDLSSAGGPSGLDNSNRGKLFYKDFYATTTFGGSSLQDYTWNPPSDQVYPYTDGSRIGPYPARATSDGIDDQVMVMDYEMDASGSAQWVGAQLRAPNRSEMDLSQVSGLSFKWHATGDHLSAAGAQVYLQIGALSEDLDADNSLDKGQSYLVPSFPFDAGGQTLYAGSTPPGSRYVLSEDGNGNNALDPEASDLVFTSAELLSGPDPYSGWETVHIDLDAAARARLSATRALRIVLYLPSGTAAGRVLFTGFTFEGSTFSSSTDAGTLLVRQVPDPAPSGERLEERYPEVADTFHPGGGTQRVLEATWSGTGPTWNITDYVTPVPQRQYQNLVFYLKTGSFGGATPDLTFSLTDGSDTSTSSPGVTGSVTLTQDQPWQKVRINMGDGTIYVNEVQKGTAAITRGSSGTKLDRLQFELTGANGGSLYIDEVHWSDTAARVAGASRLSVSWSYPETILQTGGAVLLSDFDIDHTSAFRSGGFTEGVPAEQGTGSFSTDTAADVTLLGARVGGEVSVVSSGDGTYASGGHSVKIPAASSPVTVTDRYHRNYDSAFPTSSHAADLEVAPAGILRTQLGVEAITRGESLEQNWKLQADSSWPGATSLSLLLHLQNLAGGYTLTNDGYAQSWATSFSLFAPYENGTVPTRNGNSSMNFSYTPGSFGLSTEFGLSYSNKSAASNEQSQDGHVLVEFPLTFRAGSRDEWSLTPAWRRTFQATVSRPESAGFSDDLSGLGSVLQDQDYLYRTPPVADLFMPLSETTFTEASLATRGASFQPNLSLSFSRRIGSRGRDLLAPSDAFLSVTRSATRAADSVTDSRLWTTALTWTALNVFGTTGTNPTFSFYQSDEFSNSVTASYQEPISGGLNQSWVLQLASLMRFYGADKRTFTVDSSVSANGPSDPAVSAASELSYVWRTHPVTIFNISAVEKALSEGAYLKHTERLTVHADRFSATFPDVQTTITLGHETSFELPETGSIRVYVNTGFGVQPVGSGSAAYSQYLLGVQGGIEGQLQF